MTDKLQQNDYSLLAARRVIPRLTFGPRQLAISFSKDIIVKITPLIARPTRTVLEWAAILTSTSMVTFGLATWIVNADKHSTDPATANHPHAASSFHQKDRETHPSRSVAEVQ